MRSLLVIDVGQSHVEAALTEAGVTRSLSRASTTRHLSSRGAADDVGRALVSVIAGLEPTGPPDFIAVGLSGYDAINEHLGSIATVIQTATQAPFVVLASDAVTTYLAAIGVVPGIVVAVGTGTVALGADGKGRWTRADGWGHLVGDAGSGFAVGRDGLASALRAIDGRGGSARLLDLALARHGSTDGLMAAAYDPINGVRDIAAFAADVAVAARLGDAEAIRIWEHAGSELAGTVIAVLDALPDLGPVTITCAGNVAKAAADLLLPAMNAKLAEHGDLGGSVVVSSRSPIDGVALLSSPDARGLFPGLVHGFRLDADV